jgi:hypothetical protein
VRGDAIDRSYRDGIVKSLFVCMYVCIAVSLRGYDMTSFYHFRCCVINLTELLFLLEIRYNLR